MILVKTENLKKYFPVRGGLFSRAVNYVKAVDDVSFSITEGETFGLVGESGCGKTTLGRTILRLVPPTSGKIFFENRNIMDLRDEEMRRLRREMQIVFQDPYWSLDPRMTVKDIIAEPLKAHLSLDRETLENRVIELLEIVGLKETHMYRYPHEFSGGQRQRIGIARAIALTPKFIVLDEPTSALDVSVQAQILNLLKNLQKRLKLTYLFISHDLSVVQHLSTKIGVMYLGKLVEVGASEKIFSDPLHPYTKALLSAVPLPDPDLRKELVPLKGDVPSPVNPPSGCRFHPRRIHAMEICKKEEQILKGIREDHMVACHLYNEKT